MRKEIVSYTKNDKGFYVKTENKMTDVVNGVVENYAYDKKAQNLYVLTETSNVVVTLTKDYAKVIKKNKEKRHNKTKTFKLPIFSLNPSLTHKIKQITGKRNCPR